MNYNLKKHLILLLILIFIYKQSGHVIIFERPWLDRFFVHCEGWKTFEGPNYARSNIT